MYKLMVIAGPNRGSSYAVQERETSIGRQAGNVIVLDSARVSKNHCRLIARKGELVLEDAGSSNGTFVNGILTRQKKLAAGDKISVGEFVFQVVKLKEKIDAPIPVPGYGNIIQLPTSQQNTPQTVDSHANHSHSSSTFQTEPTDLKGKFLNGFEKQIMPYFYDFLFKYQWKYVLSGLITAIVISGVVASVYPIFESTRKVAIRELGRRAGQMARQIAERNTPFLAAKAESKTEIGSIEKEDGVRFAVLTDLDQRIIAPTNRGGQLMATGVEARIAVRLREEFKKGRETGIVVEGDSSTVVAIEPVKVYSPETGRNVIIGMAVVSLDSTLSTPDMGEMSVTYSQAVIFSGIFAALIYLVIYFLSLKPFQILNDDIDQVLNGNLHQLTHEFKIEELNSLWEVINAALQRVSRGGESSASTPQQSAAQMAEEIAAGLKIIGQSTPCGLVVCDNDRKVVHMNSVFEEVSGIREDSALGHDLASLARDQAFAALVGDLFDRVHSMGGTVVEDFEFSGISFKVNAFAFGHSGAAAKALVLLLVRAES